MNWSQFSLLIVISDQLDWVMFWLFLNKSNFELFTPQRVLIWIYYCHCLHIIIIWLKYFQMTTMRFCTPICLTWWSLLKISNLLVWRFLDWSPLFYRQRMIKNWPVCSRSFRLNRVIVLVQLSLWWIVVFFVKRSMMI